MKILILSFIFMSSVSLANSKTHSNKDKILNRALAENALFKCSAQRSYDSSAKGKALDVEIKKNCASQIKELGRYYKKNEQLKLSEILISNGKRSALARQKKQ